MTELILWVLLPGMLVLAIIIDTVVLSKRSKRKD